MAIMFSSVEQSFHVRPVPIINTDIFCYNENQVAIATTIRNFLLAKIVEVCSYVP